MEKTSYTTDPQKEIWSLLGLFESKEFVHNKLLAKFEQIQKEDLDLRKNQITNAIKQAREFFSSSEQVSSLTSPVLLSYGMLNLGKALVFFHSDLGTDFSNYFRKHHGAEVPFSGDENFLLATQSVEIKQHGAYRLISKIYNENESLSGVRLNLKQLLAQIPDVRDLFQLIYNECSRTAPLHELSGLIKVLKNLA